jgi:hypothetical protein
MPVETLAFHREEYVAGLDAARIDGISLRDGLGIVAASGGCEFCDS